MARLQQLTANPAAAVASPTGQRSAINGSPPAGGKPGDLTGQPSAAEFSNPPAIAPPAASAGDNAGQSLGTSAQPVPLDHLHGLIQRLQQQQVSSHQQSGLTQNFTSPPSVAVAAAPEQQHEMQAFMQQQKQQQQVVRAPQLPGANQQPAAPVASAQLPLPVQAELPAAAAAAVPAQAEAAVPDLHMSSAPPQRFGTASGQTFSNFSEVLEYHRRRLEELTGQVIVSNSQPVAPTR